MTYSQFYIPPYFYPFMRAKKKLWVKLICEGITGIALGVILALTLGFVFMMYGGNYNCFPFIDKLFNSAGYESCGLVGGSLGILLGSILGVYWIYKTTKQYKKIAVAS